MLLAATAVLPGGAELQLRGAEEHRQPAFALTHMDMGAMFPNLVHKLTKDKETVTFEDEEAGEAAPHNAPDHPPAKPALSLAKGAEDEQHKFWEQEIKQQQQAAQQQAAQQQAAIAKSKKSLVHTASVVASAAGSANVMWWTQPLPGTTTPAPPPRVTYPKGWNQCLKFTNYLKAMKVTGMGLIRNIQSTCMPSVQKGTALEAYKFMCMNIGKAVEPFAVSEDYDVYKLCDAVLGVFHGTTAGGAYKEVF